MHLNPLTPRAQLLREVQQLLTSHQVCGVALDASSPRTERTDAMAIPEAIPEDAIVILCPDMNVCSEAWWLLRTLHLGDGSSVQGNPLLASEFPVQQRERADGTRWAGCRVFPMAQHYVRGQELKVIVLEAPGTVPPPIPIIW